ncbi:MAG: XRE family transcriptional regulator [Pseudonocardia sp.]|nr:MAG: XRE family transcriptional regulator [Pseudonocardia sp.]
MRAGSIEVGFEPSLSKVAHLWSKKPISVRLDELDLICAALDCTGADLLEPEPVSGTGTDQTEITVEGGLRTLAAGGSQVRPTPSAGAPRSSTATAGVNPLDDRAMPMRPGGGECRVCHGWGVCGADGRCAPCKVWVRTNSQVAQCRRRGFVDLVNCSRVCRLCYVAAVRDGPSDLDKPAVVAQAAVGAIRHGGAGRRRVDLPGPSRGAVTPGIAAAALLACPRRADRRSVDSRFRGGGGRGEVLGSAGAVR